MSTIDYLIVAGGGGSGGASLQTTSTGGGGAGEVLSGSAAVTFQAYPVVVGDGGAEATNGEDSTALGLTAAGGGHSRTGYGDGFSGGSGGGGTGGAAPASNGGAATGGNAGGKGSTNTAGGGGGGAGAVGADGSVIAGGNGGAGVSSSITGSPVDYGGGGGAAGTGTAGTGGTGGGGAGTTDGSPATAGTANTGGGAGGPRAAGGSGVVIFAYPTGSITATGGTITTSGGNTIHSFTADGTFTVSAASRYWVGGTGNWDAATTTHWSLTSGGAGGASVPDSTQNVFFDANSGAGTVTITATANCYGLDFTGFTQTLAGSSALNIYSNLTLVSGMTLSYTGTVTFKATNAATITSGTKTFASPIVFDGVAGTFTLADAFATTGTSVVLTNGTLDLNDKNLTSPIFTSSNTNVRTLSLGTGTVTLTGNGTVWDVSTNTNLTFNCETSTIKLTDATANAKTFSGASKTYNNLWLTGSGTGAYTIVGSNTFADFKADTPPHTINFTAGTTTTVATFTVNGTAGNLMTLQSTSAGTQWIIRAPAVVSCDYLSLQDSKAIAI